MSIDLLTPEVVNNWERVASMSELKVCNNNPRCHAPSDCLAMIEENRVLKRALRNCFHMPPSFAEEFAEKFVADQIETARKQIDEEGDADERGT